MSPALILSAIVAGVIVGLIALAAVIGWGGTMATTQRLGLCATAAGLVGAGLNRAMQAPVGWFDVLFLAGLALYLGRTYGPAICRRADAVDGLADGAIRFPKRAP